MAYRLLIVEPRGQRAERTPDEAREAYAQMVRFDHVLRDPDGPMWAVSHMTEA